MHVSFSVTYRRHLLYCNDIIINNIIAYNYGGINKPKLIFIFIVSHFKCFYVNYILISFSLSYNNVYINV